MRYHLNLGHHQEDLWYPEQTSIQEIWSQVDPQYSVQHVVSTHTGGECPYINFCTTCNNHDYVTHMCRAPRHLSRVLQYVYIVVAWITVHHSVTIDHGTTEKNHMVHWKP